MPPRWTHITINVSDMDRSVDFYTGVCGLSIVRDRRKEGRHNVWLGPPVDADEETFRRLAALSISEYERTRKAVAEKLGWRVTVLDELVANRRPPSVSATGELQGQTLNLPDAEPWPVASLLNAMDCLSDSAALSYSPLRYCATARL